VAELQALAESAREDLGDALKDRTGKGVREPGRLAPDARETSPTPATFSSPASE